MFYNHKWLFFLFIAFLSSAFAFGFLQGALYEAEKNQALYFLAGGAGFFITTIGLSLILAALITAGIKILYAVQCKIRMVSGHKKFFKLFWYLWTIFSCLLALYAFIRYY